MATQCLPIFNFRIINIPALMSAQSLPRVEFARSSNCVIKNYPPIALSNFLVKGKPAECYSHPVEELYWRNHCRCLRYFPPRGPTHHCSRTLLSSRRHIWVPKAVFPHDSTTPIEIPPTKPRATHFAPEKEEQWDVRW